MTTAGRSLEEPSGAAELTETVNWTKRKIGYSTSEGF